MRMVTVRVRHGASGPWPAWTLISSGSSVASSSRRSRATPPITSRIRALVAGPGRQAVTPRTPHQPTTRPPAAHP
ncbi:hypothetical protein Misp01_05590 [Microtetraspora sp. NBRC 13810]|nr:hypothetical protein Misp01_05590 [Microtetraspora sp. NBRC 13810]